MGNLTTYIDYFRGLAVSHKDLRHDPATETGDSDIGKKRFTVFGSDEVVTGLRSKVSFPALLIEIPENETSSENVYDIRQRPKGAFMVVDTADIRNISDQGRAYDVAEGIMYDLLKKIWQDHYGENKDECETPFKAFRWNLHIMPTNKVFTNQYGWYVQFDFDYQNTIDITQPPEAGTFL